MCDLHLSVGIGKRVCTHVHVLLCVWECVHAARVCARVRVCVSRVFVRADACLARVVLALPSGPRSAIIIPLGQTRGEASARVFTCIGPSEGLRVILRPSS